MNRRMYTAFGRDMIESFDRHLPENATLDVYWEGNDRKFDDFLSSKKIRFLEFNHKEYQSFAIAAKPIQSRIVSHSASDRIYNQNEMFKFDAVRFAHKAFALFDAVEISNVRYLIWMDADTKATRNIDSAFFPSLIRRGHYVGYLARKEWHSECGFMIFDTNHLAHRYFWDATKGMYKGLLLFGEKEWHDSYIFDVVRTKLEKILNVENTKIAEVKSGHVWNESPLKIEAGISHFKGPLEGK